MLWVVSYTAIDAQKKQGREEALEYLEILNLIDVKDAITANLTFSDRRLVEIARAIAAKPV